MVKRPLILTLFGLMQLAATQANIYQEFACANGLGYRPGDCPGNDISFQVLNLQACSDKCKATSSCVAFLWHEASHCYIKNKSCTSTTTANPANHFFDKTATTYQAFACANGLGYRPGDCPGNDISFQVLNLQACSDKCKVTSSCAAFLWNEASHCYIKSKSCTSTTTANPANHFFDKTGEANPDQDCMIHYPGKHAHGAYPIKGADGKERGWTADSCSDYCAGTADCKAVDYVGADTTCHLHTSYQPLIDVTQASTGQVQYNTVSEYRKREGVSICPGY
ncbi:uncharacterized protein LOC135484982 [Lineus longissimus]|uniref:uncharacterized protein LOC135484982 n=1 Tax=Lineus longissimus TaxID=88925 RepID=UPI00315D7A20